MFMFKYDKLNQNTLLTHPVILTYYPACATTYLSIPDTGVRIEFVPTFREGLQKIRPNKQ
jgi:hypothetical protein